MSNRLYLRASQQDIDIIYQHYCYYIIFSKYIDITMARKRSWAGYAKKVGRKAVRAGVRFAKKRYLSKGGLGRVVKDVAFLKSVLNPEKKYFNYKSTSAVAVGQVSGNSNAGLYLDTTPTPAQGTTRSTRNGCSIKLHSQYFRFQIVQQSATATPIRLRFQLFQNMGSQNAINVGVASGELHTSNPFNGLVDFNSNRNPDYMKDYKLLKQRTITLPVDPQSGALMIKELAFGMKYKSYHVRTQGDNQTTVVQGQQIMVITADCGNASTTTASTNTFIPVTAINTGCTIQWSVDNWFYDN